MGFVSQGEESIYSLDFIARADGAAFSKPNLIDPFDRSIRSFDPFKIHRPPLADAPRDPAVNCASQGLIPMVGHPRPSW